MNGKQMLASTVAAIIKVVVLILIIMVVYRWATKAYDFGYRIFTQKPVAEAPGITYSVTVSDSTTPKQVAKALQEYGLIEDSKLFYVQYLMSDYRGALKPGTYQLTTAMTADEMLAVMAQEAEEGTDAETGASQGTASTAAGDSTAETAATATGTAAASTAGAQ